MRYCPSCARELVRKEAGGRERPACPDPACGFVAWGNPVPVVAAIVEHPDGVILVRSKGWPEKMFGLVTGFLEADEDPESGVLREVKEELGLDGRVESLVGAYAFGEMNQVILAYHVRASGPIAVGEELEGYKAIAPEKLRPWPFGTGHAVAAWLARRKA